MSNSDAFDPAAGIAIIGLACRFPGARNTEEFWRNLRDGVESISFFSAQELEAADVDLTTLQAPNYVPACPALDDVELFDAAFFDVNAREAELTDPQQRLFLECAWEVLESAGYDAARHPGRIGVYAGVEINSYLLNNVLPHRDLLTARGGLAHVITVSDKDYLSTRVSYKLNLKGPSVTIQTACSTSLVAVHLACESLLNCESDLALAGGVTVRVPQTGYLYQKGDVLSPDGHCRAFDAGAQGTIFGNGVGIVALKRLAEALADGDHVHAIIRGSAINNDGASKVGYTAPSVDGQTTVIAEALAVAGVDPETITYVEAHGTGTALGDPVEIAALTRAFRLSTEKRGFCAIGSVKTNVGHLSAAAGVAGLIKTILSLKHKMIPPSLNFERPNPKIDFENSPFYVNTCLSEWESDGSPRRAGVSSFGMGGTNAHVVIEEAPPVAPAGASKPWQLLPLSAKTATALDTMTAKLAAHLRQHPDLHLADVAYTLQTGRRAFNHRRVLVCRDSAEAAQALETLDPHKVFTRFQQVADRPVVFMFSGQGAQYTNMGRGLYQTEPIFRKEVDRCCELVTPHLGFDLREVLFPGDERAVEATERLTQTAVTQPALFVIAYSLAKLWMAWDVHPQAMIGHSIGEYVAACLAGVFPLPDGLALVTARGRLMQQMPPGAMLALGLPEQEVRSLLQDELALAAVNEPSRCVVSGPPDAIKALEKQLADARIGCRRLPTSHAFHSPMMDPILAAFEQQVQRIQLHAPQIPYVSNATGTWITPQEATAPAYWAQHLRQTVRFSDGLSALAQTPEGVWLEVGPGHTLRTLAQRHPDRPPGQIVLSSLRHPRDVEDDEAFLLRTLGQLWLAGVTVDWSALYQGQRRLRVPLPTYPFERQRYWISPPGATGKKADVGEWFYEPVWEVSALPETDGEVAGPWLILEDTAGWGVALGQRLSERGAAVVRARAGETFARGTDDVFTLRPDVPTDYGALWETLKPNQTPTHIVHLWSLDDPESALAGPDAFQARQRLGFYSLLYLAQALGEQNTTQPLRITIVASNMQPLGDGVVYPEKATILGLCLVIPQEYPHIRCRAIQVTCPTAPGAASAALVATLAQELTTPVADPWVAYQAETRYVRRFVPKRLGADPATARLRPGGVYLIAGGLGHVGLAVAAYLAQHTQARLVLTSRSGLPARETWDEWLVAHSDQNPTSRRMQAVRDLEAAGAQVLTLAADVSDAAQMRAVVAQTHARFGALNGVIHAAGLVQEATRPIPMLDRSTCREQFAAKVDGLYVLDEVLQREALDFCLLCSSLSAVLGGIGLAAYAAANLFMDAFAHAHNRHSTVTWTSVNWDAWDFGQGTAPTGFAMTPQQGQLAFALAVNSGVTQLVHSTGDLQARFRRWVQMETTPTKPLPSLAAHPRPTLATAYVPANSSYEKRIAAIWQDLLGIEQVGVYDNFFDLGGDSVLGLQVIARIQAELGVSLSTVALYEAPTVSALAEYLRPRTVSRQERREIVLAERRRKARQQLGHPGVAIISMAGRSPGARTIAQLWENLCNGVESLTLFTDEALHAAGVCPELIADPAYVKARPIVEDIDLFDAAFFGYSPREAELLDPQYRLFLECAWEALERSGYNNPDVYPGEIGVFAGVGFGSYYFAHPQRLPLDQVRVPLALNQDAFATTVSYKLDLRGPSFTVQTFCSTSLVATHIACQSLLNGECDLALAGGVTIRVPQQQGHLYQKDGIESPDGHCRPFGDQACGTVFGDGLGIVVLKRLEDALEDRDLIHAVIKGSAVNNDGALKVGYTAPSVIGQAKAIATALDNAAIHPETIGYVEAHGSATKLGDPIEVQALTRAFRRQTDRKGYCALGSLKGNVGHTDRAAGVIGLIKATLVVQHGRIPPALHFERPNPEIDFENSPFFVNTQLLEWPLDDGVPRRAGVNSLGLGGTNAHVILEEPPQRSPSGPSRPWQLLPLSARTGPALDTMATNLARYLRQNDGINLADVAYTLTVGRRSFPYRRLIACQEIKDVLQALEPQDPSRVQSHYQPDAERRVVFMFPGIGDHYGQMARELYEQEVIFRDAVEQCSRILQPYLGTELRALLYTSQEPVTAPAGDDQLDLRAMMAGKDPFASAATRQLDETAIAHPVVFAVEYALARLLLAWGIRPAAMVGYSIGEYVAACLAGVLSLQDALKLVAKRAQMIQSLPAGGMLAVSLSEADVQPWLTEAVSLAAHNGQTTCVLSGPPAAIEQLQDNLAGRGVFCRRLATTHAFHSSMMRPLAKQVTALAKTVQRNPPQIPYLSNVTGTWITAEEALDPAYWVEHMCRPIRFFEALGELLQQDEYLLLEVGPGQTLGSFAKLHPACRRERLSLILPTMRTAYERRSDWEVLLETMGKLWMVGVKPDWTVFYQAETRHLLPLPTYPFERQRYWMETGPRPAEPAARPAFARELMADAPPRQELADWFYLPGWRQTAPHAPGPPNEKTSCWLVFAGEGGLGAQVATWLADHDQTVITVQAGEAFKQLTERQFAIRPRQREDYVILLKALRRAGAEPGKVIHTWNVTAGTPRTASTANGNDLLDHTLDRGFYSLLGLAQAIGEVGLVSCEILVVSSQVLSVTGHETLCPEKATILGPCRVIPAEYPHVICRLVDVALDVPGSRQAQALLANLIGELTAENGETVVALRKHQRWVESFEPIHLPPVGESGAPALRPGGVYLITGGLGGIGLAMAGHLARTVDAKLVLVGRSGLPPRAEWAGLVASPGEKKGIGRKIRHVQNLEASGAQVLVIAADVTDEAQMQAALEQAVARFGAIHGVIHAAGVPGKGLIQLKTPEMAAQVLAPKVQGTLVLERALQGIEPDFVALFSSLTSITGGGPGQVDYCAANAFLDAYAQCHAGNNKPIVSIDWGEWQWNAWEEGLADLSAEIRTLFQRHRERYGITFQEGAEALERILQRGLPQVLVSTLGLPARIKRNQTFGVSRFFEALRETTFSRPAHPRPALEYSYVHPKTETEQTLASIWQESLGFERIGSHDNFFELGGNSLLAARITSRIREAFQIDISMASLLNKPTLADLSEHIESIRWAAQEPQALDFATASDRERGEI